MPDTTFTRMQDATREDYQVIGRHSLSFFAELPDRILSHLKLLDSDTGGYAVTRLTHSLQSATRAERDGRDEEYVVCALLHDIGDTIACANHSDLAATMLQPFVSEENYWIVKHHGVFQGYYFFHHLGLDRDAREAYRGHPLFGECAAFCALYDQNSFDPKYDTLPLEHFEPIVRKVFAAPKRSIYVNPTTGRMGSSPS
jgi:predicted HD phosphohydrolase